MKKEILPLLLAIFVMSACTRTDNGPGRLIIKVTDDPFNIDYVESAIVKISKVEIRKAGEHTEYPFIVLSEDTVSYNLLELRNGVTEELLNMDIPQGSYDLIRLFVEEATLKIKDQTEPYTVKVPGGHQSGIKIFINPDLRIEGGLATELLLDFDLSKSFVMRGNMGHSMGVTGFIFKPRIRAVNLSTAGRITGKVVDTDEVKIVNAKVWIEKDSVLATAYTDTLGYYALIGIPSGTYSLFASKENYDTVAFGETRVYAGNRTIQDFILEEKE